MAQLSSTGKKLVDLIFVSTKSQPPTLPRSGLKVPGGGWVGGGWLRPICVQLWPKPNNSRMESIVIINRHR